MAEGEEPGFVGKADGRQGATPAFRGIDEGRRNGAPGGF